MSRVQRVLALIVASWLFLSVWAAADESVNVLSNPGFAGGLMYWTYGAGWSYDPTYDHTGGASGSAKGAAIGIAISQELILTDSSYSFVVGGWARGNTSHGLKVTRGSDGVFVEHDCGVATSSFVYCSWDFSSLLHGSIDTFTVEFRQNGNGQMHWDDCEATVGRPTYITPRLRGWIEVWNSVFLGFFGQSLVSGIMYAFVGVSLAGLTLVILRRWVVIWSGRQAASIGPTLPEYDEPDTDIVLSGGDDDDKENDGYGVGFDNYPD